MLSRHSHFLNTISNASVYGVLVQINRGGLPRSFGTPRTSVTTLAPFLSSTNILSRACSLSLDDIQVALLRVDPLIKPLNRVFRQVIKEDVFSLGVLKRGDDDGRLIVEC